MSALGKVIAALTQGPNVPSTRFRWVQYLSIVEAAGLTVRELDSRFGAYAPAFKPMRPLWGVACLVEGLARSWSASRCDIVFLQRNLIANLSTWETFIKKPLIFDVDDAIYIGSRGAAADRIARHAAITLCGNQFLADHFGQFGQVEVVPTAVDTDRFIPNPQKKPGEPPVIGWSGTSSGFKYLKSIQPALRRIMERYPAAVFKVISDQAPELPDLPESRVKFVKWHPDIEVTELQGLTVGIMPLENTPWERGKCSFKMLTYMSVGVPVVVSPVGMNVEVLAKGTCGYAAVTLDDWVDAVSELFDRDSLSMEMGQTGRSIVQRHYSKDVIGQKLAEIIKGLF